MTHHIKQWKTGTALMLGLLASTGLQAQEAPAYGDTPIVINERLLSFEEPQVPDFISATSSQRNTGTSRVPCTVEITIRPTGASPSRKSRSAAAGASTDTGSP